MFHHILWIWKKQNQNEDCGWGQDLSFGLFLLFFSENLSLPGLPWWLRWERICLQCRRPGFSSWVGKTLWRRKWQSIPVFLPGEFHGQRLQFMGFQRVGHDWATNTRHDIVEDVSGLKRTDLKSWVRVFLYRTFQEGTAEQEKAQHETNSGLFRALWEQELGCFD